MKSNVHKYDVVYMTTEAITKTTAITVNTSHKFTSTFQLPIMGL